MTAQPIILKQPSIGMKGFYRLRTYKKDTDELVNDTGEFQNIITDTGLQRFTTDYFDAAMFVGTGTTTPTVTDSQLGAYLGYSTLTQLASTTFSGYPHATPYTQYSKTIRFNTGVATGNLTEVGVGWFTSGTQAANHRVFSRALIVDSNGNPVTLTVLADEYLDVTYTLRMYIPANEPDQTYNIAISGVTYSITSRVANVSNWYAFNRLKDTNRGSKALLTVYGNSYVLGPVTGYPTGGSSATETNLFTEDTFTVDNGVITRSWTLVSGLAVNNVIGGIKCVVVSMEYLTSSGVRTQTQMSFTPQIPKTASKILTLNFTQTFTRL